MKWNLKLLLEDVSCLYGERQRDLLSPCLYSIVDRQFYVRFHFQEGTRLLKEFLKDKDDQSTLIMLILGKDEEEFNEFYLLRKQAEAHMVACMQSMHALSDTLGHAVYFATGQNLDAKTYREPDRISISSTRNTLKLDPTQAEIEDLIKQLIDHSDYQYLADIVNHSKHRRIIGTPFSVSMTEGTDRPYGLKLKAFEHKGRIYSAEWVEPFLEKEYERQVVLVNRIGEKLNQWVTNKRVLTSQ